MTGCGIRFCGRAVYDPVWDNRMIGIGSISMAMRSAAGVRGGSPMVWTGSRVQRHFL